MLVIPAIDLSEGECVRLRQGDMSQKTVFGRDPLEMAQRWVQAGARVLHIVDLDGAVGGNSANLEAVERVVAAIGVPVELGGGLRTRDQVAHVLGLGVQWAIMGTAAVSNRGELARCLEEFPDRIIVGIDARGGRVAVEGWTQTSNVGAPRMAADMGKLGVQQLIYTDIATDGMLSGPNLAGIQEMLQATEVPIIASGGVTTLDDVRRLRLLARDGLVGCIIGRALYSGTVDLAEAVRVGAE